MAEARENILIEQITQQELPAGTWGNLSYFFKGLLLSTPFGGWIYGYQQKRVFDKVMREIRKHRETPGEVPLTFAEPP